MAKLEGRIKNEIRALLKERGAFWSNITGSIYSKLGDPDIIVCYKGFFIGLEGKRESEKAGNVQQLRLDQIIAAGGIAEVVTCVADVVRILDRIDSIVAGRMSFTH